MSFLEDPVRRRLRLLADLPASDPRFLARREGHLAWLDLGRTTVVLSVAARQLPGLARPAGEAAAGREALSALSEAGATPLGLLQAHRLGDAEAPGIEGRVQALRASALAPDLPAMGGTVDVHPSRAALLQTHAFALGLGRPSEAEDPEAVEEVLDAGEALALTAPHEPRIPEAGLELALRHLAAEPAAADPAALCGPTPSGRAALLDLPGTRATLAFAVADAAAWAPLDPFWAAAHAVAAAARRVACVGAEPAAVAVALALGPEEPAQAWALQQGLAGLRQACLALELPIAVLEAVPCPPDAGEAPLVAPAVAVLGLIEDHAGPLDLAAPDATGLTAPGQRSCGRGWRGEGEGLFLLGEAPERTEGPLPDLHLDAELRLQHCLREGIGLGLLRSARDLAEGGLMGALLDAASVAGTGAHLLLPSEGEAGDQLFGAAPGRVLASVGVAGESALRTLCGTHRVPLCKVGVSGGARLAVAVAGRPLFDADLAELNQIRAEALSPWIG